MIFGLNKNTIQYNTIMFSLFDFSILDRIYSLNPAPLSDVTVYMHIQM